jgi:hypothetical protein
MRSSVPQQAELRHDRLVGGPQQGRIFDPMQNVCGPHGHGRYVAASSDSSRRPSIVACIVRETTA